MMKMRSVSGKQGSVIVGALIIAVLAGTLAAAVFNASLTEMKMSRRHFELQHAVTLAEAGLEEGVRAMKNADWTTWTSYGAFGHYKHLVGTAAGVFAGVGRTGEIKIYVHADPDDPSVAAEARISSAAAGSTIRRQIRVDMDAGSLFENGIVSRDSTTFRGGNVWVDSYDSRLGPYTDTSWTNRFDNGTVATLAVLSESLDIGNGHVRGYIATAGGAPDLGGGSIHAYLDDDGSLYSGPPRDWSRVTTDFYADLPSVTAPSGTGYIVKGDITSTDTLGGAGIQGYIIDNITLNGGSTLTIAGDVKLIVRGDVTVTGTGEFVIASSASMEMYVDGNVKISGVGMTNGTGEAKNALIFGMDRTDQNKTVELSGNAVLHAAVYAPTYNFSVNGGGGEGHIYGAFVGYGVVLTGNSRFHYDEALADLNMDDNFTIESWRELKGVGELLPFDTPSSLSSHF